MAEGLQSLYLIAGSDEAKIDATRARFRARAETDGGAAALEVFEPAEGRGAPDHEALLGAIPALSLTGSRRYLLADGIERWGKRQAGTVAEALEALPPDVTIVLVARGKAPEAVLKAVQGAGGEIHDFQAPGRRELPRHLVAEAERRGFRLQPEAARLLVDRMGDSRTRLSNELQRLALWAQDGSEVSPADLEEMVADTSEAVVWALADAVIERRADRALELADRLVGQGEGVTGLVYALARSLRRAQSAAAQLEQGAPPQRVASSLGMHPYAAKKLIARLGDADLDGLRRASEALADLEVWSRGGAEYGDELALTLALRQACDVAA